MTEQTRKDLLDVMLIYLRSNDAIHELLNRYQDRGMSEKDMNDSFCTICEMMEGRI